MDTVILIHKIHIPVHLEEVPFGCPPNFYSVNKQSAYIIISSNELFLLKKVFPNGSMYFFDKGYVYPTVMITIRGVIFKIWTISEYFPEDCY